MITILLYSSMCVVPIACYFGLKLYEKHLDRNILNYILEGGTTRLEPIKVSLEYDRSRIRSGLIRLGEKGFIQQVEGFWEPAEHIKIKSGIDCTKQLTDSSEIDGLKAQDNDLLKQTRDLKDRHDQLQKDFKALQANNGKLSEQVCVFRNSNISLLKERTQLLEVFLANGISVNHITSGRSE